MTTATEIGMFVWSLPLVPVAHEDVCKHSNRVGVQFLGSVARRFRPEAVN
jgi:hypothetical protein